jgi:hypothetical protein
MTSADTRRRPEGCPSDLELEELIAGDVAGADEARLRDHIAGCARCQQRRAAIAAEPSLKPDPEAWRKLLAETPASPAPRRARARVRIAAIAGFAAAAAAILLTWNLGRPPAPGDIDGNRVKGALVLTIHVKRPDGAVDRIAGEGTIRPGDELRFDVTAAGGGQVVVVGLDAAPSVTIYVPAAAVPAATPSLLPGSIVADATPGFERVFAVACPAAPPLEVVRQLATAALARAGGHPEAVTSLGTATDGCVEGYATVNKPAAR